MHYILDTLTSSYGGLLCGVSTMWSVEGFLEPEQEVDLWCVVVWCIAKENSSLWLLFLSLWCPFVNQHWSPSASMVFCRFQAHIQGSISMKHGKDVVFANALPKKRQSAPQIFRFGIGVNIFCRFKIKCVRIRSKSLIGSNHKSNKILSLAFFRQKGM